LTAFVTVYRFCIMDVIAIQYKRGISANAELTASLDILVPDDHRLTRANEVDIYLAPMRTVKCL
jgi:hypothetical protein